MPQTRTIRASRRVIGVVAAVMVGWGTAASAEENFQDCGIVSYSQTTPFVQGRTQLAILNLITSKGDLCNLVEFRIAEVVNPPTERVKDNVKSRWWRERWGAIKCGEPAIYDIWFNEIGHGGVTFKLDPTVDPPVDFVARTKAGEAIAPTGKFKVADIDEPIESNSKAEDSKNSDAAADDIQADDQEDDDPAYDDTWGAAVLPPDSDAVAKVSAAAKDIVKQTGAEAVAKPLKTASAARRELKLKKPNFRGHDVCAVQRALIGDDISVTVDGLYGPGMKKAVVTFQKGRGLKGTGVVDEKTRLALAYRAADLEKIEAEAEAKKDSKDEDKKDE